MEAAVVERAGAEWAEAPLEEVGSVVAKWAAAASGEVAMEGEAWVAAR